MFFHIFVNDIMIIYNRPVKGTVNWGIYSVTYERSAPVAESDVSNCLDTKVVNSYC